MGNNTIKLSVMKKLIICTMLLVMSAMSFSQQTDPSQPLTREDYLKKSKGQKTAAFILLGTGVAMFAIAAPGNVSFDALGALVGIGAVATLSSIPLFIASGRNKRKAMSAIASFKIETGPDIQNTSIMSRSYPTLSLKISF